jgi:hypothetical protein
MPVAAAHEPIADTSDRVRNLAGAPVVENADEVASDATDVEPATVNPVADVEAAPIGQLVGPPDGGESDAGPSPPGGRSRTGVVALGLAPLVVVAAGLGWIVLGRDDAHRADDHHSA